MLPTFNAFHPLGRNGQVAMWRKRCCSSHPTRPASSPASCCRSTAASWPAGSDRQPKHSPWDMKEGSMYYAAVAQCTQALRNLRKAPAIT